MLVWVVLPPGFFIATDAVLSVVEGGHRKLKIYIATEDTEATEKLKENKSEISPPQADKVIKKNIQYPNIQ